MRVQVTAEDISKGRAVAKKKCGCPIWHALNRQLGLNLKDVTEDVLKIADYTQAKVKGIKIRFDESAIEMQHLMVNFPDMEIEPFAFEAHVTK